MAVRPPDDGPDLPSRAWPRHKRGVASGVTEHRSLVALDHDIGSGRISAQADSIAYLIGQGVPYAIAWQIYSVHSTSMCVRN